MRNHLLLAGCLLAAPALAQSTWSEISVFSKPTARRAGAMAFDPVTNRAILNGGTISTPGQIINETWRFQNNQWTLLTPANPGPGRWGHRMVWDSANGRIVTFGGRSPTINGLANDTWEFANNSWAAIATANQPARRFRYGMVFDNVRNRVVLFGGRANISDLNDTWEFDGNDWTPVQTTNAPSPRQDMAIAFDAGTGTTVLFGGFDSSTSTLLGDTWEYRGTDWLQVTPAASPTARYRTAHWFDTDRQRVVVYGGFDGTLARDTFEYTGASWDPIAANQGPANSTEMYFCYDSLRKKGITFGGVGTVFTDDLYEYEGEENGIFGSFGSGCPHSQGLSIITAATPPTTGMQFDMVIETPPGTTAIVANGFSSAISNVGALPFDLSPFGLIGCALEVADDVVTVVIAPTGPLTYGFMVPNDPALVNLNYYTQAFLPDQQAPNGVGGITRPSRGTFGS